MKILFDHKMADQLRPLLSSRSVIFTRELGWDLLVNGKLLNAAEAESFDVMITADKNIVAKQNNQLRRISLVVVGNPHRRVLLAYADAVVAASVRTAPGSYEEVPMPGTSDFLRLHLEQGNK